MLKSKRRLIIIISILSVLCLLLILGGALCSLRDVTIDYNYTYGSKHLEQYSKEDIVATGGFPYGKNILFQEYSSNIAKIEEKFPYLKVYGVVRHFPNKIIVYIVEREALVRVKLNDDTWAVLDADFKVLNISNYDNLDAEEKDLPIYESLEGIEVQVGHIYVNEIDKNIISALNCALTDNDVRLTMGILETISKSNETDNYIDITINGGITTVRILGLDDLAEKALSGFHRYQTEISDQNTPTPTKITVSSGGVLGGKYNVAVEY